MEMTEEEVETIAGLLAQVGGAWYPERTRPALRTINKRHRDVAQLLLATLERLRGEDAEPAEEPTLERADGDNAVTFAAEDQLYVGATVVYRPPGEKRAIACRIDRMEKGRAYLVPFSDEIGWVPTHTLSPSKP